MRLRNAIAAIALACCTVGAVVPAFAQETAPKADWFLGYSFIKPDATGFSPRLRAGAGTTVTYNFTRTLGLSLDFAYGSKSAPNLNFQDTTLMAGPKFTFRFEHAMPFLEALGGVGHVTNSPTGYSSTGAGAILGGGLDIKVSNHFGIRLFRFDEVIQHLSDGTDFGYRAQTGILLMSGSEPKLIPAAACSVSPTEVLAGEPVTATATASQFNPKRTLTYAWTTSGGKASAQTATTQIDTTGLAPGAYKVAAHVTDGKKGMADCSSSFTVKEPPKHPPTISCSADPSTLESGQSATIHCTGASPDNRPLTYAWQSSTGNVAANNETGTLATTGVTGPVTITTTVTDDRGLSANTTTNVTVQAPPPPPPPPPVNQVKTDLDTKGKALLDVHFDVDKSTIRPESEKILNDSAAVLNEEADLSVFVDGYTDSTGTKAHNLALSKRRAASVKSWLEEHGIAGSRLVARGFGEANPVGDNKTEEGKQANRRVELVKMTDAEKAKAAKAAAAPKHKKAAPKKTTTTTTTTTTTKKK
jgi:outer membrane protein OmpA-like peptidoglycan-associated protein